MALRFLYTARGRRDAPLPAAAQARPAGSAMPVLRARRLIGGADRLCLSQTSRGRSRAMKTFFVEIKCRLGKTYQVASALADREIASEIYSTAGNYDILAKFHVDSEVDVGHFVAEKVQTIPDIADTHTIITFKAF
jgi:DNA-binding Lrp family transcriptional regulator